MEELPQQSFEEILPETGKFRHLTGFFGLTEKVLLIAIPIIGILYISEIHLYLRKLLMPQQYMSFFLGLVLAGIFLGLPPKRGASKDRLPWYDIVLAGIGLGIGLFGFIVYPSYVTIGMTWVGPEYVVLGALEILLVIEATRRIVGWFLALLGGIFIFYTHFTYLFPVPFYGKGIPWDELIIYFFMDANGILGTPLKVASGVVFAFILFGEFLFTVGGGMLLTEFAMGTVGRFRGGPAKVSVVASSLFGNVSGSVVANVMVDGWFTIPLMKKTGYKAEVAAAIEAAASTGGQIMPPVMGITAFLIADFLAIPYATVALAALIPALIYYYVLFLQIDLEAGKAGLKGIHDVNFRMWPLIKRSWVFFLPLAVLIYFLFIVELQPSRSALIGAVAVFMMSFFTKETRMGLRKFLSTLERAGRSILMIGVSTALAGIIIGGIFVTGLGTIFSFILLKIGGENLFLILLLTGAVCIILGTSMATGAIYIILAVLIAPALVQLGILPLAAHLFIFYMGLTAFLTPPVCFGAYAAASIAGTDPLKTGVAASRLGVAAYVVAFVFVYSPALILEGTVQDIILVIAQTVVGLGFISVALTGFLFRRIPTGKRILLFIGALSFMVPASMRMVPIAPWLLNICGFALCFPISLWEYWKCRKE